MKDFGLTRSTVQPEALKIDDFSVWVHTKIKPVSEVDSDGETMFEGFEFNMIQYEKDEYIRIMAETAASIEQQLTDTQLALVEIFEGMI